MCIARHTFWGMLELVINRYVTSTVCEMSNYNSQFGRKLPKWSTRPCTDDVPAITIAQLRNSGALKSGEMTTGTIRWNNPDGSPKLIAEWSINLPINSADNTAVIDRDGVTTHDGVIDFTLSAAGQPPASQRIVLRHGWGGWTFCGAGAKGHRRLYCPTDRPLRFATAIEHQLREPSRLAGPDRRPLDRLHRLRDRLAAAKPDSAKYHKIQAEITEAEQEALFAYAAMTRRRKPRPPGDPDPAEG